MNSFSKTVFIGITTVSLAACSGMVSHSEVNALNEVNAVGSPYTQALANEYRTVANYEQNQMYDYPDALHFARKGLLSAQGEIVLPEPIENWNVPGNLVDEFQEARARLINSLDKGARETAPRDAAIAQARFDCWIEQQEERWQTEEINQCKQEFSEVMSKVETAVGNMGDTGSVKPEEKTAEKIANPDYASPSAEELADMTGLPKLQKDELIPVNEAMFLAFFDFNSSKIQAGAEDVVAAVAEDILRRNDIKAVIIEGHTDTSGSAKYNRKLSQRRADAVKKALIAHGVDASIVETVAMGKEEPLVKTPNNTREPANRRTEITFE